MFSRSEHDSDANFSADSLDLFTDSSDVRYGGDCFGVIMILYDTRKCYNGSAMMIQGDARYGSRFSLRNIILLCK